MQGSSGDSIFFLNKKFPNLEHIYTWAKELKNAQMSNIVNGGGKKLSGRESVYKSMCAQNLRLFTK